MPKKKKMINFPEIINKISQIENSDPENSDLLYNPPFETLNYEEISKYLDEFDTKEHDFKENQINTPINKNKLHISDSPFIDNMSENCIRSFIYKSPTPFKTPQTNKKTRSFSKTLDKIESPNFGTEANKENFEKSTTKFKCNKSIYFHSYY